MYLDFLGLSLQHIKIIVYVFFFLSINLIMDKKSDIFFFIILILVFLSFVALNVIRTVENYIIKKHKITYKKY